MMTSSDDRKSPADKDSKQSEDINKQNTNRQYSQPSDKNVTPTESYGVASKDSKKLNSSESINITVHSDNSDSSAAKASLSYKEHSKCSRRKTIAPWRISKECIIISIVIFIAAFMGSYLGFKIGRERVTPSSPQASLSDPTNQAQSSTSENSTILSPTMIPTNLPTNLPTNQPSISPTMIPTNLPTNEPSVVPILPGQFYFSDIESGPLVGHTTSDSTSIWAFHGKQQIMQLTYYKYGESWMTASNKINMEPRPESNNAALITIDNLDENTHYVYELRLYNSTTVVARGQFKTAPVPFKAGQFEYLLTSCMNIEAHKGYPDQPVWDHVLEKAPDFAIMAGDTVYLTQQDWTKDTREVIYDRVWYRNMKQRRDPHFRKVIGSMPTYAAWDDHEYGSNNAEKNQPGKENSLKAFRDVWANPAYGTPQVRGNFYDYYWGDVHFIVLDNRWYRDRGQQTQLGEDQKLWLYDQLDQSQGTFKVIVLGCDIMEAGYSRDVDDIGKFVSEKSVSGVIFNAGDIHRNEFKQQDNDNWLYPVTQYTSSGIARDNWMRPWSIIKVNTELVDPEITAYFYGADSKDLDTTWSNDVNLRCSSIEGVDRWKEARCTETMRLSDLTPK